MHRLPREFYQGPVSVAFTLCVKDRAKAFIVPHVVDAFNDMLSDVATKTGCIVPVYCFMPDHQHVVITGTHSGSDTWKAVVSYKQKTGYWLSVNRPGTEWQKDFYDHVIQSQKGLAVHVKYILDNPVRKQLVKNWEDYPYTGSIGCRLDDILNGMM